MHPHLRSDRPSECWGLGTRLPLANEGLCEYNEQIYYFHELYLTSDELAKR